MRFEAKQGFFEEMYREYLDEKTYVLTKKLARHGGHEKYKIPPFDGRDFAQHAIVR